MFLTRISVCLAQEISTWMVSQCSLSDSWNNRQLLFLLVASQKLKVYSYCWKPKHTLDTGLELSVWILTWKPTYGNLDSMQPENTIQAATKRKQILLLSSSDLYKSQQWPEWQDIHKGVVGCTYILVTMNCCLIRLKVPSTQQNSSVGLWL